MAVMEGTWRHHESCNETKRSSEGGVSVRWSGKKMDGFTPKGYLGCVSCKGVLIIYQTPIYICGGTVGIANLFASLIWRSSHLFVEHR